MHVAVEGMHPRQVLVVLGRVRPVDGVNGLQQRVPLRGRRRAWGYRVDPAAVRAEQQAGEG